MLIYNLNDFIKINSTAEIYKDPYNSATIQNNIVSINGNFRNTSYIVSIRIPLSSNKNKIINIHHSFLPAFPGAKPYHSAFDRGVKIIGATSHYVTKKLDFLIIGEKPTKRKVDTAKELKIKILTQNDWLKMLNKRR